MIQSRFHYCEKKDIQIRIMLRVLRPIYQKTKFLQEQKIRNFVHKKHSTNEFIPNLF